MTDEELNAIEARCAAANDYDVEFRESRMLDCARDDLPRALAEVRRLRDENVELRRELNERTDANPPLIRDGLGPWRRRAGGLP